MLDTKPPGRSSATVIGLLIFFVPFFTYLSPENLRQLSKYDVLETFLSLIIILIVTVISSSSIEILLKRFFKKKIMLFPLFCFAFYLNFLYIPFSEPVQEFLYPKFGYTGTLIFIFFELCCLAIIILAAKFNTFSIRMILIFSILMLIKASIPLASYLAQNIGKNPTISYEIKNSSFAQDDIEKKRNVYYIILDGMMTIENAELLNITTKNEELDNLSNAGLKYIDKSQSSYGDTQMTLASILLMDYHHIPSSPKFKDTRHFFPSMMYQKRFKLPLLSYLKEAKSYLLWSGNAFAGCNFSSKWSCVNERMDLYARNSFKFYLTTPFARIALRAYYKRIPESQNSIDMFLKYIEKNGTPKAPFFAFIHHGSPHSPYLVTSECKPTRINENYNGYKSAYKCALLKIKLFMEKINSIDPEAIVVFQADHGWSSLDKPNQTEKEIIQLRGKIFNAIKAPKTCFEKYGLPKNNINTVRFTLNCAYGFKLPYRKNIHYIYGSEYGTVIEKNIYE